MQKSTKVAIIAHGEINDCNWLREQLANYDHIIAADGGLNQCVRLVVRPDLVIGDLDSCDPTLLKEFHDLAVERYPEDKDQTDLELAIDAAFANFEATDVTIFGAIGKRMDHTLSNLHLLRKKPGQIRIETETESLFLIAKDKTFACKQGQTISFIPLLLPLSGIHSKGLKWELDDNTFDRLLVSISNVCLSDKITIQLKSGLLLCCLEKPAAPPKK